MNFGEKLKQLRKQKGLSQEQLAEKIYVSRQTITKWESGNGIPDIENLLAISSLFNESLDSLLSEEKSLLSKRDFIYESRTEYDLDAQKKIDLKLGVAHEIIIEKTKDEKIQIVAASNKIPEIGSKVKVKISETKKRMDVCVKHSSDFSDVFASENLFILVRIPEKFVPCAELFSETENLKIRDITFDSIEFSGKTKNVSFVNSNGHLELDTSSNLLLELARAKGKVDLNQIRSISKVKFDGETNYFLKNEGRFTRFVDADSKIISGRKWSRKSEEKSSAEQSLSLGENDLILELNGWKSEVQILKSE